MQEVEGFLNGTLDYAYLKGDTGPLVYPAGFVYLYSLLYFATDHGKNIALGQWIFVGLYLIMIHQVFKLYSVTKKVIFVLLLYIIQQKHLLTDSLKRKFHNLELFFIGSTVCPIVSYIYILSNTLNICPSPV